jgi:hypothetical protein
MLQSENLYKEYARWLPWSRERGKLASLKLGVFSEPTGSEPMWYVARVLPEDAKEVNA